MLPQAVPYKLFCERHPDYDEKHWCQCRAFYAGGNTLLKSKKVMDDVFPPHLSEQVKVYAERRQRAYFIPYPGEIIDSIVAGLFGKTVSVSAEPEPDPFYDDFFDDVSPPGGKEEGLNELLKRQTLTALLTRRAWTLVDLPEVTEDNAPQTLSEQEEGGYLRAYACSIDPEMVLDWEESEDGELEWALVLNRLEVRGSLLDTRNRVLERYTYYTADSWQRFEIQYEKGKKPEPDAEVPMVAQGTHTFGRVPLVRLELPEGLWAMGKILPIAIAHFNLRNALSWAEYKSLFPVLAAFKQGVDPLNPVTEDQDRELNQTIGQGYILGLAEKDRLEFIGPDSAPFSTAMADLAGLRDEMHRVLHQMALSVDNSAAALQRSADSKQVDQAAAAVVLRALGQLVKDHVVDIYEMVEAGRGDPDHQWRAEGLDDYEETSLDGLMGQAETVDTISIPSATFKRLWTFGLARRLLGDNATPEDLDAVRKELEENITNEMFMGPTIDDVAALAGAPGADDDEDEPEPDEDDDKAPPAPSAKRKRLYP